MNGDISRDSFDVRKRYAGVVMQQGRVQLDADWNEQQSIARHHAETTAKDVIGPSGAPVHDAGFKLSTDGAKLTIGAGRYYVNGLLCENFADVDYLHQPDFPNAPDLGALLTSASATSAIVYLEAWRRPVTGIEDPEIREVALGGADTAIRMKTVWQVRVLPVKPAATGPVVCNAALDEWDALIAPRTGLMSARGEPSPGSNSPCLMPPGAGYQRLENQLYRIEIHTGGDRDAATLKWSRDNGSVETAVESFDGQQLIVHDLGRDEVLGFSNGQTVELTSDLVALGGQPGPLFQIDHVEEGSRLVALTSAPTAIDASLHPKLRRWDSGEIRLNSATTADGWIELEDGVQVKFEAGTYRTGDYWLAPARTLTGDLDWPFSTPQPPRNPPHVSCRLGILTLTDAVLSVTDCRMLFTPIAEKPPAVHITGVNWVHDDVIAQQPLQSSGLQIFFDGPVDAPPGDSGAAIMSVLLDTPAPLKTINPTADPAAMIRLSVPLTGDVSLPSPNVLSWTPTQGGGELANLAAFLISENIERVRLRVCLRGSMLWSEQGGQNLYVDGRVSGKSGFRADGTPRIDLTFPSGDGRRSSDFESWLYLQLQIPPPKLTEVKLDNLVVNAGGQVTGTVLIDRPAQMEQAITLTASDPAVTVPPTVQIPVGQTQATFPVTAGAPANTLQVMIGATALGSTVQVGLNVQVINLSVTPAEVTFFVGGSQQFSAQESGGISQAGVSWSVQGDPAGVSVSPSGLFTASVAGDYQVVATSNADHARTKVAVVHVRQKPKDNKETKEKDNDKVFEKAREKVFVEKRTEKFAERLPQKFAEKIGREIGAPADLIRAPAGLAPPGAPFGEGPAEDETPLVLGRAFIRPAERPDLSGRPTG